MIAHRENVNRSHVSYPCVLSCCQPHRLILSPLRRNQIRKHRAPHDYGAERYTSAGRADYSAHSRALLSLTCAHSPVFDICSSTRYATPINTASRTPSTNFQFTGQRPLPSLPRLAHHSTMFMVSRPSNVATIAIPTIQRNVCISAPRSVQPADFGTVAYNRARLLMVNQTAALRSRVSSSIDIFPRPSSV